MVASSLNLVRLAHSLAHYLAFSGIGAVDISKLKSNGYYTIAVRPATLRSVYINWGLEQLTDLSLSIRYRPFMQLRAGHS